MMTWVLVASRAGARIFSQSAPGKALTLEREFANPEGRLHDGEVMSGAKGAVHKGHGAGTHAYEGAHPHERFAALFARELSGALEAALAAKAYNNLVLVCEPGFLGHLRAALPKAVHAAASATVEADLYKAPAHDLPAHLAHVMRF